MTTVAHHSVDVLQKTTRQAEGGLQNRLRMVILAMESHTVAGRVLLAQPRAVCPPSDSHAAPQIAIATGISRRTAQACVGLKLRHGLPG